MITWKCFQPALYMSLSLWVAIVCEASLGSDMEWLRNSISKADASKHCKQILQTCGGRFHNFTSVESMEAGCGIAECCQTFSDKLSSNRQHRIQNICFAKWGYTELLEDNDELRNEAREKLERLMQLEKESPRVFKKARFHLSRVLRLITNTIRGRAPLLSNSSVNISPEENRPKRFSKEKSHHVTSRSTNQTSCTTIMTTILVTWGSTCTPKSLIIWYCKGFCATRAVPHYASEQSSDPSVEHCECCSGRVLRYKTITFLCTDGNRNRTVAWPFECACRPCSSVPTMVAA
ncbi:hypothetical protein EGW08_019055 [Elysia chlorotica]|uniref:CTCK domain-containing protein n=1 Tax=Elysia chlorotica TaxID=188477 RepID=A0A3S1B6D3_ELYCH|nr:hypothetical protein EGW08_019055 [Elysia chlorotica]